MYEVEVDEITTKAPSSLIFSVEVKEFLITDRHTAEVTTILRCNKSESITVGVRVNLPDPWVSNGGSPQIVLIPPKTYPNVARNSDLRWLPERDTFSRPLDVKSTKIDPSSSIEISYEVWALPNDKRLGIQPGRYKFSRDYGEFIMNIF